MFGGHLPAKVLPPLTFNRPLRSPVSQALCSGWLIALLDVPLTGLSNRTSYGCEADGAFPREGGKCPMCVCSSISPARVTFGLTRSSSSRGRYPDARWLGEICVRRQSCSKKPRMVSPELNGIGQSLSEPTSLARILFRWGSLLEFMLTVRVQPQTEISFHSLEWECR